MSYLILGAVLLSCPSNTPANSSCFLARPQLCALPVPHKVSFLRWLQVYLMSLQLGSSHTWKPDKILSGFLCFWRILKTVTRGGEGRTPLSSYAKKIFYTGFFPKAPHFWKLNSKTSVLMSRSSSTKPGKSVQPFPASSADTHHSHLIQTPGMPLMSYISVSSAVYFCSAFSLHGSLEDVKASLKMPGRKERLQLQPLMLQRLQRPLYSRRRMAEPCWTSSSCSRDPRLHHCPVSLRCLRWVPNPLCGTQGTHFRFHDWAVRSITWV